MTSLAAAGLAFVIAVVLVRVLARGWLARAAGDIPNARSSHTDVVPRTGGLGLLAAASVVTVFYSPSRSFEVLLLVAAALSALSFADDLWGLTPRLRLVAHSSAAIAFLSLCISAPIYLYLIAFLTIVWMSNLYNFMDGSDGLAGGMALFGFGTYAIAAVGAEAESFGILPAALAGASAGFLIWNSHKAIVFMGDSGSIPLGFLASAIGMLGWQDGHWPFWFPALVFLPFILDATVTLVRRILRGEKPSDAHRSHYYQKALQMGLGHRGTAIGAYVLMIGVCASSLYARDWELASVVPLILGWFVVFAVLFFAIDRKWRGQCLPTV